MAAKFVPTSRLSNIIQMIMLSRQSGILRAIRGQDAARQMGQIRFVDGNAVSVLFGQMVNENAMNALMGWGECMYSFDEFAPDGSESDSYYSSGDSPYPNTPLPSSTSSWPSYGYPSNPSAPYPSSNPSTTYPSAPTPYPPYQQYPQYPQNPPPQYPPNQPYAPYGPGSGYAPPAPNTGGYTGAPAPDAPDPYYRQSGGGTGFTATSMPGANFRPEMLQAVPYQTGVTEPIEQLPLDRRERMILLLVNGQRSMLDLVRLTHRTDREIYAVLQHLALLGLIQFRM